MKIIRTLLSLFALIFIFSCSDNDNDIAGDPFVVAFENLSTSLTSFQNQTNVTLVYSETANQNGTVTLSINETNASYGVDYTTIPEAVNNQLVLDIVNGEINQSFAFNKTATLDNQDTSITFTISEINYGNGTIQGNTSHEFNVGASLGGSLEPSTGGPNQQNQVFVDLSENLITESRRDVWDLAFYSGDQFRVRINNSLYMFAGQLSVTDIDAVSESDSEVQNLQGQMNFILPGSTEFIDDIEGDINNTAIAEISADDNENNVYLVRMGFEIGTTQPDEIGTVEISGDERGWKKIRVLRSGNDYLLQFADLNDTNHDEVIISKSTGYNFTYYSMVNDQTPFVEPEKEGWDMCFTVSTTATPLFGSDELVVYGFSDFNLTNRLGNVASYEVEIANISYDDFSLSDFEENNLNTSHRTIGSNWRSVFNGGSVNQDVYYILRDSESNTYKLKFLGMTNENGDRGYPRFEYELLQ
ncbi:MAG: HmuY family protein [Bacteroidota bacterium]